MHPLLQKQNDLHTEASALLEQILSPLLGEYGQVSVGGSYAYQLLNHPDLDIDIVNENANKEMFAELSAKLISLKETSNFKSGDRASFPHTHPGKRPTGYWISPEIHFGKNIWKLDVWLQKPEWHTGDTNRYAKDLLNIDDEKKINILSLKESLIDQNLYGIGKEFVSVDVYEAVLRNNVRTIDEMRRNLTKNKI